MFKPGKTKTSSRPGQNRWGNLLMAVPILLIVAAAQLPIPATPGGTSVPFLDDTVDRMLVLQALIFLSLLPLILGMFLRPAASLIVGFIFSFLPVLFYGTLAGFFLESNHVARVLSVVVTMAAGTWLSFNRVATEERLANVAKVSAAVQEAVLRPLPVTLGPVNLSAKYVSASKEARVGGDFYDALLTKTGTRVILGDVRGKGVRSVRITNHLLGAFRHLGKDSTGPQLMRHLDQAMVEVGSEEDFATMILLDIEETGNTLTGTMYNAGHPSPLRLGENSAVEIVSKSFHLPLGFGDAPEAFTFTLANDESLLLFTDGLAESRREGEFIDLERVGKKASSLCPQEVVDTVYEELSVWADGHLDDDVCLLALSRTSVPSVHNVPALGSEDTSRIPVVIKPIKQKA